MTLSTQSTAIGERSSLLAETTFELKEVVTHSTRVSLLEISTGIDSSFLITSNEKSNALWKPKRKERYTFRDDVGVNALVEERFGCFEQSTSQHDD